MLVLLHPDTYDDIVGWLIGAPKNATLDIFMDPSTPIPNKDDNILDSVVYLDTADHLKIYNMAITNIKRLVLSQYMVLI